MSELTLWELWDRASGNIVHDTEDLAAMRAFLRGQLASPAETALDPSTLVLIVWDMAGEFHTLAETVEQIRAWLDEP